MLNHISIGEKSDLQVYRSAGIVRYRDLYVYNSSGWVNLWPTGEALD